MKKEKEVGHLILTLDQKNMIQIGNDIIIELPETDKYGRPVTNNYQQRIRITAPKDIFIGRIKKS